jgi:hypothetical protein
MSAKQTLIYGMPLLLMNPITATGLAHGGEFLFFAICVYVDLDELEWTCISRRKGPHDAPTSRNYYEFMYNPAI